MDNARTSVIISNQKRPRIDYITAGDKEGHSPFEIPQLWRTEVSDSSSMNQDQTAEEEDLMAVANISAVPVDRSAVAPRFSLGDVSSHLVVEEVEEGQHDVNKADEPASHSRHDEEPSVSAEPNTPEQSDTETVTLLRRDTSHTWLGKSPEGLWRAGAGSPPDDNEEGSHEGGTDAGETHANLPIESNDSKVKGRCVASDAERHGRGGDSHRSGQSSLGVEGECDSEGDGQGLRKRLSLMGGGGEQDFVGRAVPSDDVNMISSCSNGEVNLSGKVFGVKLNVENNGGNDKMDNAKASVRIKDGDNTSVQSNPTVGCIESPITHVALLVRNAPDAAATKTSLGLVIDDLRGGEGRPETGKMIADTTHKMAGHACETMMPAQITQGPSEGDNDAGPFSVIDAAVCSQAGRRDEEKSRTSQSAAGVGLSPSGIVTAAHGSQQTAIPDHFNGRQSAHQTNDVPSSYQDWCPEYFRWGFQLKGEAGNTCQSTTKECFSIITNESLNKTQDEAPGETGNAVVPPCISWPASSPCEVVESSSSAEEKEEQNLIPAGALCEHQGPTDWSLNGSEPLNAKVETKITESILVKTICFEGEQLPCVLCIPEKIKSYKQVTGTNQHQNVASDVPAFGLVTDWINAKLGQSRHQSVVPNLHTEDTFGTEAGVLSPSFCYRPAISMMDMIEQHGVSQPTNALVPGSRCITHSITYRHEAHIRFTQECFQPSPLPPSAPVSSDCTPVAVDTFEKIELSSDDDGCGDEGLGPESPLTSLLALLESPRLQFPRTQPESSSQRELTKVEVPGAGAVKEVHPQGEDTGKGCFDSINSLCSTISLIATLPVSQSFPATCQVSQAVLNNQSSAHDDDDDDIPLAIETFQEFDMEQQFDMVVQELQQFFEIDPYDISDGGSFLNGPEETGAPSPREGWTTPSMERVKEPSPACLSLGIENNEVDIRGDCILIAHRWSPEPAVPPHDPSTCELDQQVPPPDCTRPCLDGEDSMYTLGKHREEKDNILHQRLESSVSESRRKLGKEKNPVWTPCFQSPLSDLQTRQRQTGPERRLEPLRTCSRPIRVGLSKRAKTSHLHRNQPYK